MNPRRRQMLQFIRDFEAEFGMTPSVQDIAFGLSMKRDTVTANLQMLEHLGYLRLEHLSNFALRIVKYRLPGEAAILREG